MCVSFCYTYGHWKFRPDIKTRALFYPFVCRYLPVVVLVRACITMPDYLNDGRVFLQKLRNKIKHRNSLSRGPCICRIPERIQSANIANPN